MAKSTQVIQVDIITKGLSELETDLKKVSKSYGDISTYTDGLKNKIDKARSMMKTYGSAMPTEKAKELEKMMRDIAKESNALLNKKKIKIYDEKDIQNIKEATKELQTLEKQKAKLEKNKVATEGLKNQKTILGKSTKSIEKDLQAGNWKKINKISNSQVGDGNGFSKQQIEAANAAMERYNALQTERNNILKQVGGSEESLNSKLTSTQSQLDQYKGRLENLSQEHIDLANKAEKSGNEMADGIKKATDANIQAGKSFVSLSGDVNKSNVSLGKAARALFSWTQVLHLGRRLLTETIRTVTEMDKALNGMMVVTGQTREEVNGLIGKIQDLSKETSTAMTDVANLVTEYVRQGRSMSEAFTLAEETAKAAKIAGISTTDSIQYMTSAINGFNLAATDATRVSDVFANLAAISATNYEQLAVALSKVSAQANLAGMSMEYTTALLAKGIETTQEAPESIGTALKTVVARMRELSDYGSTLEDGGSVNKVENALAAAGIQLRNVNGEFRNLEDIFNELGPKWDYLNTMQQQAIAQAVAGTRQQSRFVAIMQDWERTQELATEAQDSAGASAAQYAKYAEGMEGAMTRLQTSWQSFTQSLVDSEGIIKIVNMGTDILTGVSDFIDKGNPLAKTLLATVTGIFLVYAATNKLAKSFNIEVSKETQMKIRSLELSKQSSDFEYKRIAAEQGVSAELADQVFTSLKQMQLQDELEALATQRKEIEDDATLSTKERLAQLQMIAAQEASIQAQKAALGPKVETPANVSSEVVDAAKKKLELEREYARTVSKANASLIQQRANKIAQKQEQLKINKLEQDKINKQLQALKNDKNSIKNTAKKEALEIKLGILKAKEVKLGKQIETQQNKVNVLTTQSVNLYKQIGSNISMSISSGLSNIFSTLGPIGNLLGDILSTTLRWGIEVVKQLVTEKGILGIKKQQQTEEQAELAAKESNVAATGVEAVGEKVVEEIKEDQTEEEIEETGAKVAGTAATGGEIAAETAENKIKKKNTAEEKKGLGAKIASAIVSAAKSAAEIPMVGWIIALALLAAAGTAIAVGAAANASGDKNTSKKIEENQATIYNTKKKNNSLKKSADELESLQNKGSLRTAEEDKRMQELIDSLKQENEKWENLPDEDVLFEVQKEINKNNDIIKSNTDSNYKLALTMEDFSDKVAQQALIDKLKLDQEDMIASAIANSGEDVNADAVAKAAAGMAESLVKTNVDYLEKELSTQEVSVGQIINSALNPLDGITDVMTDASEKQEEIGEAALESLNPIAATASTVKEISSEIEQRNKALEEQAKMDNYLQNANQIIVDFAVSMEAAGDDLTDQLTKYIETYNKSDEQIRNTIKTEYQYIDVLSRAIGGIDEVNKELGVQNTTYKKTADSLEYLSETGILTSEALKTIIDVAQGAKEGILSDEQEANIDKFISSMEGAEEITGTGGKNKKVDVNLKELREELGLTESASVNDIKDEYIKKYAKNGVLSKPDDNGNYEWYNAEYGSGPKRWFSWGQTDEKRTAEYNALVELSTKLGDLGDYSKSQLELLKELNEIDEKSASYNPIEEISSFINGVYEKVGEVLPTEEEAKEERIKELQSDRDYQIKASMAIWEQGQAMIDRLKKEEAENVEASEKIVQREKDNLANIEKQLEIAKAKGLDTTQLELDRIDAIDSVTAAEAGLTKQTNYYKSALSDLEKATLAASGRLDDMGADEKWTRAHTAKEKASAIRDKAQSGENLTQEDIRYIASDLSDYFIALNENWDFETFLKQIEEGNALALAEFDNMVENIGKAASIDYSKSAATYEADIEKWQKQYDELLEKQQSGVELTKEELKDLESLPGKIKQANIEMATQQWYAEHIEDSLSNIVTLLADEVELRYLNAKLSGVESSNEEETIKSLRQQLILRSKIAKMTQDTIDAKIKELAEKTGLTIESVQSLIKNFDGNIALDPYLYTEEAANIIGDPNKYENIKSAFEAFVEDNKDLYATLSEMQKLEFMSDYEMGVESLLGSINALEKGSEELTGENLEQWVKLNQEYVDTLTDRVNSEFKALGNIRDKSGNLIDPNLTEDAVKQNIQFINGQIVVNRKWYKTLSEEGKNYVTSFVENEKDAVSEIYETTEKVNDKIEESFEDYINKQLEAQDKLIELYKAKLEKEQEELQKSLDKRKEMYEKYFDALDEEESDEDFEEQQAKLQRAIAALASASDAASLAKRKELEKQLEDLEDDQLSTERERRREATMASLDNESEMVDNHYEELLNDNRRLWEDITKMNADEIYALTTEYNEEWKNATDLRRIQVEKDNKELYESVEDLLGITIKNANDKYDELEQEWKTKANLDIKPITSKLGELEDVALEVVEDIADAVGSIEFTKEDETPNPRPIKPGNNGMTITPYEGLESKPAIDTKKANGLLNNIITAAKNSNAGFNDSAVQEAIEAYAKYTGDKAKARKTAQENVNTLYGYFPDVTTDSLAIGSSTWWGQARWMKVKANFPGMGITEYFAFPTSNNPDYENYVASSLVEKKLNEMSGGSPVDGALAMYNTVPYIYMKQKWLKIVNGHSKETPYDKGYADLTNYMYKYLSGYSKGGIVDYTGLAMVHGTPNTPEAFLNASQTAMFADLAANLQAIYSRPSHYTDDYDDSSEVTIENLTIAVDAELTNENIPEIGQSLADALFDGIRRSGYNINTKK